MAPVPITSEGIRSITRDIIGTDVSGCMKPVIGELADRTDEQAIGDPLFLKRFLHIRFKHYTKEALEMSLTRGLDVTLKIAALLRIMEAAPVLLFTGEGQRRLMKDIQFVYMTDPDIAFHMCMGVIDSHDVRLGSR